MNTISNNLKTLGFDKHFIDSVDKSKLELYEIARVTTVHKESYAISNGKIESIGELVGKLIFSADSPYDYPTVGDWVFVNYYDDSSFAIIHEILPRKTLLQRKTAGKRINVQLIAANIDVALVIQSLDENYNLRRLERYLATVNQCNVKPVVLLSKSDLLSSINIVKKINEIKTIFPELEVLSFSNKNRSGLENVSNLLLPGKTYCLLGSSGVGKTSLLNNLLGNSELKTMEVRSKDSRGRHATTRRQLLTLGGKAMVVDTPGMRELGNISIKSGLNETFSEIEELSKECLFNDCKHINDKGCAVLAAIEAGEIPEERYNNYLKMEKESRHNEMSYLEKKQKDRKFGKFIKSVMKDKRKMK